MHFTFLSDEGPSLETLDLQFRVYQQNITFLYFDF